MRGVIFCALGGFVLRIALKARKAKDGKIVFGSDQVLIPRIQTGETIPVAYEDVIGVFWSRYAFLRLRLEIRTGIRSFWVHRTWLDPEWSLERLAKEFKTRLDKPQ